LTDITGQKRKNFLRCSPAAIQDCGVGAIPRIDLADRIGVLNSIVYGNGNQGFSVSEMSLREQ
jgi:hypothetical protein